MVAEYKHIRSFSHREILVILSGLLTGLALAGLDQTIVATALPTIVGELGGLDHLSWVVTAYLLTATVTTPLYGKLSDLYGRRHLFQAAIVIFLVGSALCGLAQDMFQLVLFRAVQGIGGGGLIAMAFAVVADVIPPRERGRYTGYLAGTFALTNVIGPPLGGLVVDHLDWRWIFYINLPLGAAALVVTSAVLKMPFTRRPARVDFEGAALLVGGVTCLLLALVWGGDVHAWRSATIIGLIAAGTALVVAFVMWEAHGAAEPLLPMRLFHNSVFRATSSLAFLLGMGLFGAIVFLPVFLQVVRGQSPTSSGLLMFPMMAGMVLSSVVCGRLITRSGRYKAFVVAGFVCAAGSLLAMSTMDSSTPAVAATVAIVGIGVGAGMASPVVTLAAQNAVNASDLGVATSASVFFRSLGGSLGVSVFGAVLNARLAGELMRRLPTGAGFDGDTGTLLNSPERIAALPDGVRTNVVGAIAESVTTVFLWAVPVMLLGVIVALLLREVPLKQRPRPDPLRAREEPEWAVSG